MKVRMVCASKNVSGTSLQMVTLKEVQYEEEMIKLEYHFSVTAEIMDLGNNHH